MIVVDASAILELLLKFPAAPRVSERLFAAGETLHVPYLLDLEVAQALRRYCFRGELTPDRGLQALDAFAEMSLTRHSHLALLPRIWQLRQNLTAYDAAYLALAEFLGARLVTRDRAFAASSNHAARIELL